MWTTKDGKKIKISEMKDTHLKNTIRMLEKYAQAKTSAVIAMGEQMLCSLQGEMAIDSVEHDLLKLYEHGLQPEDVHPAYIKLIAEAEKRGILPCGKQQTT